MKKIFLLLCCLVALPLAAQSYDQKAFVESFATHRVPENLYDALEFRESYRPDPRYELYPEQAELLELTEGIIILDFSAEYCVPCRKVWAFLHQEGFFDQWKEKNIRYYKVDMADRKNLNTYASKFRIQVFPSFVFLNNGKEYARRIGGVDFTNEKEVNSFVAKLKQVTQIK